MQCFAPRGLVDLQKNPHRYYKRECKVEECGGTCTACYTQHFINKDGSKTYVYGCWGPNFKSISSLLSNATGGCYSLDAFESNKWLDKGKDMMQFSVQHANDLNGLLKPYAECLANEFENIEKYEKVCGCETSGCNNKMATDDMVPQQCINLLPESGIGIAASEKQQSLLFIAITYFLQFFDHAMSSIIHNNPIM